MTLTKAVYPEDTHQKNAQKVCNFQGQTSAKKAMKAPLLNLDWKDHSFFQTRAFEAFVSKKQISNQHSKGWKKAKWLP